ncbi:LPO_1073/Vpar_1526 family protein [Streptomyces sp. NPDC058867]|uniref:LPO_1073/Vpar_1526 family protein n=1 Tax=unclassified Streptomyces TaxID=2593676 RepID=UPI0036B2CE93
MWQRQKAGDRSALIQARQVNIGVGVEDIEYISKKMAMEVFSTHSRAAFQLMTERVELFAQTYVDQLLIESPNAIENIKDPGVQAAILDAESAYAKTGDDDLGALLVDILCKRTATMERNIVQLALAESIQVAQKLTAQQYSSLSLIFLLRHVRLGAQSLRGLHQKWQDNLEPVAADAVVTSADAQHLIATGCAVLLPVDKTIPEAILATYPGFFCMGLEADNPAVKDLPESYFQKCIRDPAKVQVCSADETTLSEMMERKGANEAEKETLRNLLKANPMSDGDLIDELTSIAPSMRTVQDRWEGSIFPQLSLTSVGIVLAHSNVMRLTEGRFNAGLEVFLSPSQKGA